MLSIVLVDQECARTAKESLYRLKRTFGAWFRIGHLLSSPHNTWQIWWWLRNGSLFLLSPTGTIPQNLSELEKPLRGNALQHTPLARGPCALLIAGNSTQALLVSPPPLATVFNQGRPYLSQFPEIVPRRAVFAHVNKVIAWRFSGEGWFCLQIMQHNRSQTVNKHIWISIKEKDTHAAIGSTKT